MSLRDILVHVNISSHCADRVALAARLAKAFDARLTGLYSSAEDDVAYFMMEEIASKLEPTMRAWWQQMRGRTKAAFDAALERIAKRMRRYKRRLRDHRRSAESAAIIEAQQYVLAGGEDDEEEIVSADGQPAVIAEMTTPIETMTVADAVMRLDLANLPALMALGALTVAVGFLADDAIIVAAVLRSVVRHAGVQAIQHHWPPSRELPCFPRL